MDGPRRSEVGDRRLVVAARWQFVALVALLSGLSAIPVPGIEAAR